MIPLDVPIAIVVDIAIQMGRPKLPGQGLVSAGVPSGTIIGRLPHRLVPSLDEFRVRCEQALQLLHCHFSQFEVSK